MKLNGIELETLKTTASLADLSREERQYQIAKAFEDLPGLKDMVAVDEVLASLNGLTPEELEDHVTRSARILEVLGESIGNAE